MRSGSLARHTFTNLMRRLSQAGFKNDFVRPAILPDWWDATCAQDPSLLPDVEIRVARFLGLPLSAVRDTGTALVAPSYPGAQLRRVRDLDRDRLGPAIHSAIQIAAAAVRSLRDSVPIPIVPPSDGLGWREEIARVRTAVTLDDIVGDLWLRGIPVVPLDVLPAPSFQGAACIVEGRPVIVLAYKHDEPGLVAFRVTHEAGHIAANDCAPNQPVVDEEEEILDDTEMERRADRYATRVLVGGGSVPLVNGSDFKELARGASQLETTSGIDAGFIISAWASRTGDYPKASMAVKALYRGSGARRLLRKHFDRHVDLEIATEGDRALLRCVHGDPERVTPAG
jgi:hypothetical protein